MKNRLVFFNGEFVEEKNAKLSIYDSALMFGDMVFEMTRSFNKKQFLLDEHIDRLLSGLKILRIKIKYSKKNLIEICEETVKKNSKIFSKDDEHRLMMIYPGVCCAFMRIFKRPKEVLISSSLIFL